ncbi:ATP synthase F1 subunit gamma [Candidatus Pelagisphaera phototrophica]|uniref:ATP synthase F1 subunit gamma n=1 Tax=Candidatus Pelagisphaera phototrophica TaxID=2684113 RepID=UPI0019E2BD1F|nr:ATP synthase F1 subunit gamma [Candidatus Pelagisphaera phototrophica]QXD32522.1 ATP synthase F1 subunit gamma [Candidatus Pelagisphaera phototrophica]
MPNLREIRRRIKSVKNTRQITKAMELVAASKMKKAQQAAISGQPYAALLAETLSHISSRIEELDHPFFKEREVKTRGIIIVSTDRGLCGPLNGNLIREILNSKEEMKFVSVGRKGRQFLSRTNRDLLADFEIGDAVKYTKVKQLTEFMIDKYLSGEVDTVEILYPRFVNVLTQAPSFGKLLPITGLDDMITELRGKDSQPFESSSDDRNFVFEPDPVSILNELLPLFVDRQAYQAILSARASEHSARMVAMKTAKDNASKLLDSLTLQFNKARQAAITQEILEIAAATSQE